jgi:hypothetical protein
MSAILWLPSPHPTTPLAGGSDNHHLCFLFLSLSALCGELLQAFPEIASS